MKGACRLEECLDDLERRIDPDAEDRLLAEWVRFAAGRFDGDLFAPSRPAASAPRIEWPRTTVNGAQEDFDVMALSQYVGCSDVLAGGGGAMLNVRCNYGTGILPSLFGAELFMMDEEMNTLPTTRPLPGVDAVRRVIERGVPDLRAGLGAKVFDMAERFVAIAAAYPRIGRYVHIYHPDLQGPMDVCELLWGSGLFLDLVDQPGLVHDLLRLVTDTYARFMEAWHARVPPANGHTVHWGMAHRGRIMLRDDSAMNLSPGMFEEFIKPYDQRLLSEFGGGAVHFCGRGDHYIASLSEVPGLYAVAMSQPHLNDMETIFRHTVDKGIPLIGLNRQAAERALASGRWLHGRAHVW